MYSLYIDTHDRTVLIILFKDGKILTKNEINSLNKHSEIALPAIVQVLEQNNLEINNIKEIIVVNGPGSFTGVRIAVTISKTLAYCLNIPIKVIDALTVIAINDKRDKKIVAIEDRNGAFVGVFNDSYEQLEDFVYLNKSVYVEYKENNEVLTDIEVDYEKVYDYAKSLEPLNPHDIKPLYIKGISALNDKKN